ncbi:hypothetical protein [Roseateles oligotrophus]|uniref:Lipoprotein n=1 Tax=Roseateles oligotrophus TaxID=1769250 RepID=A0ABT2YAY5_9BURK|nr:hypothetical protein [Roseateles oligotrophus]MCV2367461.1 hypothetical protein [Roseateles oligotrophus]
MKTTTSSWIGLLIASGLLALSGCAATPTTEAPKEDYEPLNYTTGSNLGRRGPPASNAKSVNKEDVKREVDAMSATNAADYMRKGN